MITRWRIEAEAENVENVEGVIEGTTQAIIGHLRDVQPKDEWECTDEVQMPIVAEGGEPVIYMRRVFKRNDG